MLRFKAMFHFENDSIQDGSFVGIDFQCNPITNKWYKRKKNGLVTFTVILTKRLYEIVMVKMID